MPDLDHIDPRTPLDSLDQVELAMAIEEAFNVEIPDKDAERFRCVQDVLDYLKARGVTPQ